MESYIFRKSFTDKPDREMMDLNVFLGISFPGWLGITALFLVSGLYQYLVTALCLAIKNKSCVFEFTDYLNRC